jgi:excisionase family DNA binding protein
MIRVYQKGTTMKATSEEIEEILGHPVCAVEEAAKVLDLGRGQAYNAVKAGEIPSIRIGRRVLVPTAALRRMIADTHAAA